MIIFVSPRGVFIDYNVDHNRHISRMSPVKERYSFRFNMFCYPKKAVDIYTDPHFDIMLVREMPY